MDRASDLVNRSLSIADRAERPQLLGLRGVIDGDAGLLPDAVRTVLEGIALSEDPSESLELLLEACLMATYIGDTERLAAICRLASEFKPATDVDRFIVILLTAGAAELEGDFNTAERLSADAIELAERLGDARCLIWASVVAGRAGTQGDGLRLRQPRGPHRPRAGARIDAPLCAPGPGRRSFSGSRDSTSSTPRPRRAAAWRATSGSRGSPA